MTGLPNWIVGDDIEYQILLPVVQDLMGCAGRKDYHVPFDKVGPPLRTSYFATTGDDQIEFELRGVRMILIFGI
jgi:hypothetical protein